MQPFVKRSLLIVGAPLAVASVLGGSVAFAAISSDGSTPSNTGTSVQGQASPTPDGSGTPSKGDHPGCDHDGGGGAQDGSTSTSSQL